jgi:iron-sulfur cluster repair protein YtfE (RIC family)
LRTRRGDALTQLAAEHSEMRLAFERLAHTRVDAARRHDLLCELCMTLRFHMLLEEEILYPAVRRSLGADVRTDLAQAKHDTAKPLLAQLVAMRPGQPGYETAVAALGDYIREHIAQEQTEMFPRIRCTDINLRTLARRMQERKQVLTCGTVVFGEVLTAAL